MADQRGERLAGLHRRDDGILVAVHEGDRTSAAGAGGDPLPRGEREGLRLTLDRVELREGELSKRPRDHVVADRETVGGDRLVERASAKRGVVAQRRRCVEAREQYPPCGALALRGVDVGRRQLVARGDRFAAPQGRGFFGVAMSLLRLGEGGVGLSAGADLGPVRNAEADRDRNERRERGPRPEQQRAVALREEQRPLGQAIAVGAHPAVALERDQVVGERGRGGVAVVEHRSHRAPHDRCESRRDITVGGGDLPPRTFLHELQRVAGGRASERHPSAQHEVEDAAEAEHVGARTDTGRVARGLLGAHVRRRPQHHTARRAVEGVGVDGGFVARNARQPPVDEDRLAEAPHHDVVRLEVAMDEASLVRVADRLAHLHDVGKQPQPGAHRRGLLHDLGQRRPLDERHRVVRLAATAYAHVVDREDRRMRQSARDPDLP